MKITDEKNDSFVCSVTFDELVILAKCVIECVHREDKEYFSAVFGYDKLRVEKVAEELNAFFENFNLKKG